MSEGISAITSKAYFRSLTKEDQEAIKLVWKSFEFDISQEEWIRRADSFNIEHKKSNANKRARAFEELRKGGMGRKEAIKKSVDAVPCKSVVGGGDKCVNPKMQYMEAPSDDCGWGRKRDRGPQQQPYKSKGSWKFRRGVLGTE